MPRPITVFIDTAALRHNLAVARTLARGRRVWAVVKANAYGHGIERVVAPFAAADGLALLDLAEAERARAAGWRKPILLLEGVFTPADVELADRLELTSVVHANEQIDLFAAARVSKPIAVYLKINSGMNRLGFAPAATAAARARLSATPQVRVVALMTHFANADRHDGPMPVDEQLRRFAEAAAGWDGDVCLANSSALVLHPAAGGDAVRPGILLYGGTPFAATSAAHLGLRAAMRLEAGLLAVQDVAPGAAVGYGSRWTAARRSRIGIVACGYADGYPRSAPDGTPVAVGDARAPLIGRVSMDMITVDLTDLPQAQPGDRVQLWGERVPIDEVAQLAGTVGYELMCASAPRVSVVVTDTAGG